MLTINLDISIRIDVKRQNCCRYQPILTQMSLLKLK